ncbi:MAG: prepilin-type N-terminal cleavage/methylation domain-containing protein, partial [Armatimonadota bacterium]|nr:prepilin-type N-terminal cleavage/methylation domain-containing protein [Armatimonadota bacterium]
MRQPRRRGFTLVEIMVVVFIIGLLIFIALPNFVQAREKSRRKACIGNLLRIEIAKQQWAMDHNREPDDTPQWSDIVGPSAYIKGNPATYPTTACPAGGVYTLNNVSTAPTC